MPVPWNALGKDLANVAIVGGEYCEQRRHLTSHTNHHTGGWLDQVRPTDRSGERPDECNHRGGTRERRRSLTSHMRDHTDVKPFKCTECDGIPISEYACEECDQRFQTNEDLEIDMNSHKKRDIFSL